MSVIQKMEFKKFLEYLGLTEAQVKVIYSNELDVLQKQEAVMLANIADLAKKTEAIQLERKNSLSLLDGERLNIENQKKGIISEKTNIQNSKNELLRTQRDTTMLREKLEADQMQFRRDREYYTAQLEALEGKHKIQAEILRELDEKSKGFDKKSDELYLTQTKVNEDAKKLLEAKDSLETQKAHHSSEVAKLVEAQKKLADDNDILNASKASSEQNIRDREDNLKNEKLTFEAEVTSKNDALRQREYKVVEAEKLIEKMKLDLKVQKETLAIKGAKK